MSRRLSAAEDEDLIRAERDIRNRLGDQPFDFGAMFAISNIYRAATVVRNHMVRTVLADRGLSWAAFTVMWVLWIWGEQETRHVAAEAGITKGTLTGVLNTLERGGLVLRTRHPDNGRLMLVRLSPKGTTLIEDLFPRFNAQETFAASGLSAEEREELPHLLRKIIRQVDGEAASGEIR